MAEWRSSWKKGFQKSGKPRVHTDKSRAEAAGVSHDTIHRCGFIEARASEAIKQALRQDRISINKVYLWLRDEERRANAELYVAWEAVIAETASDSRSQKIRWAAELRRLADLRQEVLPNLAAEYRLEADQIDREL